MKDVFKVVVTCFCVGCLTVIELYSIRYGHNGTIATAIIAGITGLAGACLGLAIGRKQVKTDKQ